MLDHLVRQPPSDYSPVETVTVCDDFKNTPSYKLGNIEEGMLEMLARIERLERTLFGRQHD